jgi:hypothetical protein
MLACLLLAAAALQAQPVARSSIDMFPGLERDERNKLYSAYYANKGKIDRANKRIQQIDAALKKDRKREDAKTLRDVRTKQAKAVRDAWKAMFDGFRKAGLSEADIARMQRMPLGALREERYNHSVVLEAPDLDQQQRRLLERCVASTDAAQRALHEQHRFLQQQLKDADPLVKRQLNNAFYGAKNQIERRFWRIAYYALRPEQMVATRKLFSPRYGYIPQLEQQCYLLPGLSASQATRVRALFREMESELVADQSAVRRYNQKLNSDKKMPKKQRDALVKERNACNERMYGIRTRMRDTLRGLLDEKQLVTLRSRAPLLNTGEYYQGLRRNIDEMKPTGAQRKKIDAIRKRVQNEQRAARQKIYNAMGQEMRKADLGPDSPQAMTMQMMQRNTGAANFDIVRAAGREALTQVLTADQVSGWIIAPKLSN